MTCDRFRVYGGKPAFFGGEAAKQNSENDGCRDRPQGSRQQLPQRSRYLPIEPFQQVGPPVIAGRVFRGINCSHHGRVFRNVRLAREAALGLL